MTKNKAPPEYVKGYHLPDKAWYRHEGPLEIVLGLFNQKDGTTLGEIGIRWHVGGERAVPRIEVFDDGWRVLFSLPELGKLVGLGRNPERDAIVALLKAEGFVDLTMYEES